MKSILNVIFSFLTIISAAIVVALLIILPHIHGVTGSVALTFGIMLFTYLTVYFLSSLLVHRHRYSGSGV